MQNFTTTKDAQIVDVKGLIQAEAKQNTALQVGDSVASGTVLSLAQGSEITLIFDDGSEQKITAEPETLLASDAQTIEPVSITTTAQSLNQVSNETAPDNVQADIDAIQALIESGDDLDLPDTAAGGLTANEGTDFVTLDRDGNQLLAGAGYDTTELDNPAGAADVPVLVDPIDNVNALPEAVNDTFDIDENTELAGSLLGNDDLGDEATTVTNFDSSSANGGTVTVDSTGNFSYTPVADFVGTDTFTYTITDADGDASTATVTVNIANVNKLPEAVNDSFDIDENTQLAGSLLDNDELGDEDTTVTAFDSTSVNGGTVSVDETGNFTYTPATDFVGSDTFTYTITDADGDTSTATVTVNIANVNKLPEAVDDTFATDENTQLTGTLLGNDDLGDEDTTVTAFDSTSVNGGTVTVDETGNFTYTPATDFIGADTFTYTITDADGDTSTATVTVNIENINALPDAVDDTFGIDENTQLTGTLLGNDDLGDEVTTVTAFDGTSVNGGTVTVDAGGNFTYTPATDFVGADTFTYTITDADGDTSTATVTVNVANVNALPDAVDDAFGINENTQLTGNLLGNDDLGDEVTTVTAFDSTSVNGGAVAVNAAGNFTYLPANNFVGTDTFTYTITDADGDTSTATVTVTVANVNVNALPDAVDDTFTVDENTQLTGTLLGNDDLGDNPTTVTAFDSNSTNGGTVTVDAAGNFTYTPVTGFVGADTFTYTITDADGDTSTATVTVNVADVNLLPDAVDDTFTVDENTQLTGTLLGNDDLGDNPTTVTAFDSNSTNGGTVTVDAAGNFTYTPVTGFVGADTFTYTITDVDGDTSTATVTVNVADVNLLPDAVDDTFTVDENTQLTGTLLGNDDLGDNPTTVTAFDSNSTNGGTVSVNPDGTFSYTPVTGFVGADTFTYTITDVDGDTSTATVTVNVADVNLLPDAVDDTFTVDENTQLTGTLLGNDDLGDNPTTVTAFDSNSTNGGTVTVDAAGNFTYTPVTGFVGADTFTYTITDVDGDTSTATVTVNVADVNLLPDAVDDTFTVDENTQLTGTLLGNDDLGDNPTTVTAFDSNSTNGGTVSVNPDGTFSYTPVTGFVGADTFTYTITDVDGDTSTATVTVTVASENLLPDAVDDNFNVNENTTISGALLGNDDLGDNPTTVTAFDSVSTNGGTVNVNPDGTFSYTPATDFVGADTFTYTITDVDGDTSTATVTVTVANVNVPPTAQDDSFSVDEGSSVSGNVITHNDGDGAVDSDGGDGATLTVTQVDGVNLVFDPVTGFATFTIIDGVLTAVTTTVGVIFDGVEDNGILQINADGDFTYENKGFSEGSSLPTFDYTLSDGTDTDTAIVSIAVATNAPTANDDASSFVFTAGSPRTVTGNVTGLVRGGSSSDTRDDFGLDSSGSPAVTQVEYMGVVYLLDVSNTSSNPIEIVTEFGSLFMNINGGYSFVEKDGLTLEDITADDIPINSDGNLELEFTYTIQDGDTLNSETSTADLAIEIVAPATTLAKGLAVSFDETSGLIDTDFDAKSLINADKTAFKSTSDLADLSDILTDDNTDGLETYLVAMGEDDSAMFDIDLAAALKDSALEEAVVLAKGQNDLDNDSFATVTNGLLEGGGTIMSDQSAATNTPIAEFDSAELL